MGCIESCDVRLANDTGKSWVSSYGCRSLTDTAHCHVSRNGKVYIDADLGVFVRVEMPKLAHI